MSAVATLLKRCAQCGTDFQQRRLAQVTCGPACKQALYREKRNAGHLATSDPSDEPVGPPTPAWSGINPRLYPGLKPLSEVERRVMGMVGDGLSQKANGPAEVAASPSHVISKPQRKESL